MADIRSVSENMRAATEAAHDSSRKDVNGNELSRSLKRAMEEVTEEAHTKGHSVYSLGKNLTTRHITDDNRNFEEHLKNWWFMISQHNAARKSKVNDVDQLTLFKDNFPENSIRRKMYETSFKVAMDDGRIPDEADKVLQEMIEMFRKWHCDSEMQIRARHNAAFHNIAMEKNNHFKFRAEFEALVVDMERDGVYLPTLQLRDEYLMKLDMGLREHVLEYNMIKGEDPETWQRVAEIV